MAKRPPKIDPALYGDVLPRTLSKSERRRLEILEAAIACYATIGLDNTTYERIAEKVGISRSLVNQYFPQKELLSEQVMRYIRVSLQKLALDAVGAAGTPEEQLAGLVESTFKWVKEYDTYVKVWILFYYYCTINDRFKRINTELVQVGHDRITSLLAAINAGKQVAPETLRARAKTIQVVFTGALVSAVTETLPMPAKELAAGTVKLCLELARL